MPILDRANHRSSGRFVYENNRLMDIIPRSELEAPYMSETKPFELGKTYRTKDGKAVTIRSVSDVPGYECVQGDDLSERFPGVFTWIWRYNRASDRGRVTGSAFDMSDPRNLIPEPREFVDALKPPTSEGGA